MKEILYSYLRMYGVSCLILVLFCSSHAQAYIDPGTTSVAFSALGYVFSMAVLGLAFFIRPLRYLMKSMFNKLTGKGRHGEDSGDSH
jgi:hypothetical protein